MYNIPCDKCGSDLIVDEELTINFYVDEEPFKLKEDGSIIEDTLNTYLVYRCINCEECYKFTYKDWEKRFRLKLERYVMEVKKRLAFRVLNPKDVNPDRGVSFCGYCEGYDKMGNCFNDIISHCVIRSKNKVK